MSESTKYESRTGRLTCTPAEFFGFITNIKNFEQFIPAGNIKNWQASERECSFQIPPFGTANVRIKDAIPVSRVTYSGDVLKDNEFELVVNISGNNKKPAEVKLSLTAALNPFLKMMANEPINRFMEMLISEMERFNFTKIPPL